LESSNCEGGDETKSVASSIISEMRLPSKLRDNGHASSLNNLLPEDELSTMESSMTGICIQTEHVEQVSGNYNRRSNCEGYCSGKAVEDNKFKQSSVVKSAKVPPDTANSSHQESQAVVDSYEVAL